jgi:peptidoglycan/xylan/chitin deacetylase (PgdA/CDA1 family)
MKHALLGLVLVGCNSSHAEPTVGKTSEKLVSESERLTGADLPAKHLVFTFDDGPSATSASLSTYLTAHGIKATFFIDGSCVNTTTLPSPHCATPLAGAAAVLSKLVSDGHLIGNHTTTGRDLVKDVVLTNVVQELTETDTIVAPLVKWNEKVFRAPHGSWIGPGADADAVYDTLKATAEGSYVGPVFWNIDADCTGLTATACGDAYLREIHARGSGIVRFDDVAATVDVIGYIVPLLQSGGYVFDPLLESPALGSLQKTCDQSCVQCTGPTAASCTSCPNDSRLVSGACMPCTVCGPGLFMAAVCTTDADTVCSPCVSGTFSPITGATSCVACGSCDDHDDCTTDVCDRATGCAHQRIANCSPFVIEDAGSPTPGGKIDEENNVPLNDSSSSSDGCSAQGPGSSGHLGRYALAALCILLAIRRRVEKRSYPRTR